MQVVNLGIEIEIMTVGGRGCDHILCFHADSAQGGCPCELSFWEVLRRRSLAVHVTQVRSRAALAPEEQGQTLRVQKDDTQWS